MTTQAGRKKKAHGGANVWKRLLAPSSLDRGHAVASDSDEYTDKVSLGSSDALPGLHTHLLTPESSRDAFA